MQQEKIITYDPYYRVSTPQETLNPFKQNPPEKVVRTKKAIESVNNGEKTLEEASFLFGVSYNFLTLVKYGRQENEE